MNFSYAKHKEMYESKLRDGGDKKRRRRSTVSIWRAGNTELHSLENPPCVTVLLIFMIRLLVNYRGNTNTRIRDGTNPIIISTLNAAKNAKLTSVNAKIEYITYTRYAGYHMPYLTLLLH